MRRLLMLTASAAWLALAGLSANASTAANAPAPYYPDFPRIGANWLAKQNYEDPAIQKQISRAHIANISVWPGWETGRGTTVEQVIRNIKAANPDIKIFNYVLNESIPSNRDAYKAHAELYAKLDSMKWFLYSSGSGGSIVPSFWKGSLTLNNTLHASADKDGLRWVDWYAKWSVNKFIKPIPSMDGLMLDNVFWKPRVSGDWNRDGKIDSSKDPTVQKWQREGLRRHFDVVRELAPTKYQLGNIADWGQANSVLTEYQGQLNGGLIEGLIGYSWSVETSAGWHEMMKWYRKTINALAAPKFAMFHQVGSPTDYQAMRYGLASCLMDDGYYTFNADAKYSNVPWFDEYNVKLGKAISGPSLTAWQKGVYRRDFEHGIALVNPKGNGTQTVTLETDFKRLTGTQAPSVNNGQTTRTVTLQDRDGIILLRNTSKSRPAPPKVTISGS